MKTTCLMRKSLCALLVCLCFAAPVAASSRYDELAGVSFKGGYPSKEDIAMLKEEIFFERAVQAYIWALPALNLTAMVEGGARVWGGGYNVMPIWKDRLNAKTKITTPNSDVIYGLAFLDLKKDGPMVIEVPPQIQGILDDRFQRPLYSEGEIDGKIWCGDVGLPGPDKGKGGKYLVLPPDYKGEVPSGYYAFRSQTYAVMLLERAFFKDPGRLGEPVQNMAKTRIYPLGKEGTAKPMQFPNASQVRADMLYPKDGRAFEMLQRIVDEEYVLSSDMEMRGVLAAIGIVKGRPFLPTEEQAALLDKAARTAASYGLITSYTPLEIVPNSLWYKDRRWINPFPGNADFTADTFNYIDPRTGFFTNAFTASPGMAVSMERVGAKYPATFVDAKGDFLLGGNTYRVILPKGIPVALFWSLTAYDSLDATLVENGMSFSSLNAMDKPVANPDGSTEVYFSPENPGRGKNWIRTVPGKGFFVILRLYGPLKPFFDQSWKPGDIERIQ